MKSLLVLGLGLLTLLAVGCAGKGYAAPKPDIASIGLSGPARTDCSQIYGTAFRSADERSWFQTNCSKWPETSFDNPSTVRAKAEDPACTAMRGRPYANDKDRQWFLSNCNGTTSGTPTASSSDPAVFADSPNYSCAPTAGATPTPAASPTGQSSRALPAASATAQAIQSCSPPRVPTPVNGDRTDCYAISGTVYHSKTEEAWFLANCMGGQPSTGQPPAAQPAQPSTTQPPGAGFRISPQNYYCNPANPGYPNARGRVTQPC